MKRKLMSRKLWAACVGFIAGQAAACNKNNPIPIRIVGQITAASCVLGFLFAESRVDAAGAVPLILPSESGSPDGQKEDKDEDTPEVGAENR